ncbi:MAG: FAD-binding oxidoreductase [Rhodobacteraceae bacterium]|nr:FAD-binding oxidoreductase [Paracoccaceae bacterium]
MDLLTANDRPGQYPPSWYAATTRALPAFPPLEGETAADVAVVGGGYTGLSAALHLAEAGFDVALVEANRVGWGASGRNGGQVGPGQRQDQVWLEKAAGKGRAHALWDLAEAARGLVTALVARHGIVCDLRPGIVYAAHKPGYVAAYHRYAAKLAHDYGYESIVPLDRAETAAMLGTAAYCGGIFYPDATHLHPLGYALGLARAAASVGVRIFERSRVLRRMGARVETAGGAVAARHAILATNGYHGDLESALTTRVMPINNFMVASEPLGADRAGELIPENVAAADSRFVVNYWRLSGDRRMLFGGGESYGYRFPADIAGLVRPRLLSIYPQLRDVAITHAWGGTLAITTNRMPAFQRLGSTVYSAAGYSGHGVAIATLAGKLMAEAVAGDASRFDVFAGLPQPRFPGGAGLRWPLLALAMSWYALRDRL